MNTIYSLAGYGNAQSFKEFSVDDIDWIQNYARKTIPNLLETNATANGHDKFNTADSGFFFGAFTTNTEIFEIVRGDRNLLKQIALYIKNQPDDHFQFDESDNFRDNVSKRKTKSRNLNWAKGLHSTCAGHFFGYETIQNSQKDVQNDRIEFDKVASLLFTKAMSILEKHGKNFDIKPKEKFAIDFVTVDVVNGDIKGKVRCTFCEQHAISSVSVFYKQEKNSGYWVLSNLNKHLTKHHNKQIENMVPKGNETKPKDAIQNKAVDKIIPSTSGLATNKGSLTLKHHAKPVQSKTKKPLSTNIASICKKNDNLSDVEIEDGSSFTYELSGVHGSTPKNLGSNTNDIKFDFLPQKKIPKNIDTNFKDDVNHDDSERLDGSDFYNNYTKDNENSDCILDEAECSIDEVESKRNALYSQMTMQLIKMSNATAINGDKLIVMRRCEDNVVEMKYCAMDGDGSCLFSAIVHQLFRHKVNSSQHQKLVQELRHRVVQHIKANVQLYVDSIKPRLNETADILTKNIETDCANFVTNHLAKKDYWGGLETLKAVCEIYRLNIGTVTDDGLCSLPHLFNPNYNQILLIYYTKRNHYDSIVQLPDRNVSLLTDSVIQFEIKSQNLQFEVVEIH